MNLLDCVIAYEKCFFFYEFGCDCTAAATHSIHIRIGKTIIQLYVAVRYTVCA